MAYTQAIEGKKGIRHRGFYQDTTGRYKSAGTYDTAERALEVARRGQRERVVNVAEESGGGLALLGNDGVLAELGAENVVCDRADPGLVAVVAESGAGGDRADSAERPAWLAVAGGLGEPPQQHGGISALRAVVRVELVHHDVTDVRILPQG